MNHEDRKRMGRLYAATAQLPWPNRSRTLGPGELSRFFCAMENIQPQILRCIMAIARSDDPEQEPEEELAELEKLMGEDRG